VHRGNRNQFTVSELRSVIEEVEMERTIKIDDTLQERVDGAKEEVEELLVDYLNENPDVFEVEDADPPCLNNDLDYDGRFHQIVDSSVPVYTHEIDTTWYLHKNKLEEAYENAGIGKNPLENNGMVAIYCYIEQEVSDWYNENAQEIGNKWLEQQVTKAD